MSDLHQPFTARHRPRAFAQVVGQADSVERLKRCLAAEPVASLLLFGPAGTGKTSLARIAANVLLCDDPQPDGEPCARCPVCCGFRSSPPRTDSDYLELNACEYSGLEAIQDVCDHVRSTPLGRRKIVVLDEAQGLSPRAGDALLKILEEAPSWAVFILITTNIERIKLTVRSRCAELSLRPPRVSDQLALAAAICEEAGLPYEGEGLALVVGMCAANQRSLTRHLEQVGAAGAISAAAARQFYRLDELACVADIVEAALGLAALGPALKRLSAWHEEPEGKRAWIERYLTDLTLYAGYGIGDTCPAFVGIDERRRRAMIEAIIDQARRRERDPCHYFASLAAFWSAKPLPSAADALLLQAVRFQELLTLPVATPARTEPDRSPWPTLRRRHREDALTTVAAVLTAGQARTIWDAASFLTQRYGCLLNLYLVVAHAPFDPLDHTTGYRRLSSGLGRLRTRLTRRLRILGDSSPDAGPLHFISVNEADAEGKLTTHIGAHVPVAALADTIPWIRKHLLHAPDHALGPTLCNGLHACTALGRAEAFAFHVRLARQLIGGLDPAALDWDEAGRRGPLCDLIGVPHRARRRAGRLERVQRYGTSESLGPSAQAQAVAAGMAPLSVFGDRAWSFSATGWELCEYADRQAEQAARAEARRQIDALYPPDGPSAVAAKRREALAAHNLRCAAPARQRPRRWPIWPTPRR